MVAVPVEGRGRERGDDANVVGEEKSDAAPANSDDPHNSVQT